MAVPLAPLSPWGRGARVCISSPDTANRERLSGETGISTRPPLTPDPSPRRGEGRAFKCPLTGRDMPARTFREAIMRYGCHIFLGLLVVAAGAVGQEPLPIPRVI